MRKEGWFPLTEVQIAHILQNFFICFNSWMRCQYKNLRETQCFTLAQFKVLFIINNFKVCNMSLLSEAMEVSRGTMTSMLNKLVEEGYVERRSSSEDRRNVYVSLTKKGEEQINRTQMELLKVITQSIQKLDEDQRKEMYHAMTLLNDIFKATK